MQEPVHLIAHLKLVLITWPWTFYRKRLFTNSNTNCLISRFPGFYILHNAFIPDSLIYALIVPEGLQLGKIASHWIFTAAEDVVAHELVLLRIV